MDAFVFWPDHDLSDQVRRWAEVAAAARDRLGIS
jgi:hypothetical protein